ncbi:MAG: hypothetical protein H7833_04200 [Magnetococcus sp. DMHC-1]|nr:hypothetical protein [Magnetococcales bacterium]
MSGHEHAISLLALAHDDLKASRIMAQNMDDFSKVVAKRGRPLYSPSRSIGENRCDRCRDLKGMCAVDSLIDKMEEQGR